MRILQVIDRIGIMYGGSAEVVRKLSKGLSKRGHEVTIYASDAGIENLSLDAINLKTFKTTFKILGVIHVTPSIMCADFKSFDVIHLHNYLHFQNLVACARAKTPIVLQPQGTFILHTNNVNAHHIPRVLTQLWKNYVLRKLGKVIACSNMELEQCVSIGIKKDMVNVVPNGIDMGDFASLPTYGEFRSRYGIGLNEKMVLSFSRLHPIKGIDLLIQSISEMQRFGIKLVIVGDDCGCEGELKSLVVQLGMTDRVIFTGALYGRDKLSVFVDADVYILPSKYEIFGLTVLESLACGTPVIITKECGLSPVINGSLGQVINRDVVELSSAILNQLNNKGSRQERIEWASKYDWSNIVERMENVYKEILK